MTLEELGQQIKDGARLYSDCSMRSRWVNSVSFDQLFNCGLILSERDILFLNKPDETTLLKLNQLCLAQFIVVGSDKFAELADGSLSERQFRELILGLDSIAIQRGARPRNWKSLFLDRDGVIIENIDYNADPEKVKLIPGICETIQEARKRDYKVVVVTNQSGIARKKLSTQQYQRVTWRMQELLAKEGCFTDLILHAPFHPEFPVAEDLRFRHWRKPRPGMILKAAYELDLDLSQSILIGDSHTDLVAGVLAGVSKNLLFPSKKSANEEWEATKNWHYFGKFTRNFARLNLALDHREVFS